MSAAQGIGKFEFERVGNWYRAWNGQVCQSVAALFYSSQPWCLCFFICLFCFSVCVSKNLYIQERLAIDEVTIRGRSAIGSVQVVVPLLNKVVSILHADVACVTKIRTCMKTMNWSFFVAKCLSCSRKSISMRCRRSNECVHRHMLLDGHFLILNTIFVERQPCCAQRTGLCPNISGQIFAHDWSYRSLCMRCPVGLVLCRRGIRATGCRASETSGRVQT